jgi:hypothetical protein
VCRCRAPSRAVVSPGLRGTAWQWREERLEDGPGPRVLLISLLAIAPLPAGRPTAPHRPWVLFVPSGDCLIFPDSLRRSAEKQVILVDLQPLSAWSPFRASNMCDKLYRIASIYENGGEGVCRMVTEGEVGRIS